VTGRAVLHTVRGIDARTEVGDTSADVSNDYVPFESRHADVCLGNVNHLPKPAGGTAVPGAHVHAVVGADNPNRDRSAKRAVCTATRNLEFSRPADAVELLSGPLSTHGLYLLGTSSSSVRVTTTKSAQLLVDLDVVIVLVHVISISLQFSM